MATVREAARVFGKDPATIRKWIKNKGCPVRKRGRRGPGNSADLDIEAIRHWRGLAQAGPTPHAIVAQIAEGLGSHTALAIRVEIPDAKAAAALLVVWDNLCLAFLGTRLPWEAQPEPIRAIKRQI